MPRSTLLFKWMTLLLLVMWPVAIVTLLTFDLFVAAASTGFLLLVLLWFTLRAEAWVTGIHDRWMKPNPGLLKTYRRVVAHMRLEGKIKPGVRAARLMIYRDPSSFALIYRSLFSPGTLLISQGLLAQYREDELRTVIEAGLLEVRTPGVVLATLISLILSLFAWVLPAAPVKKLFPTPWQGELLVMEKPETLTASGALVFLAFLPFLRVFYWLGQRSEAGIYWTSSLPRVGATWPRPMAFHHLYLDV